jgi:hypothetical protein
MPTTAHRALPYPQGSDAPNVPADIQALATALDGAAIDSQGLFSARPAAGSYGKYYYAVDTDALYRDNGTTWVQIVLGTDARLTDTRTPTDNTVTAAKIASDAVTTVKILDGNVTTNKLAANAVTAAKIEAQQAWQTISISGTNITTTNVGYFKDSLGVVHFRGDLIPVTNTVADGTTIGTLPAGYRPGTVSPQYFHYQRAAAFGGYLTITSAGVIALTGMNPGGASSFFLSTIYFRAEN